MPREPLCSNEDFLHIVPIRYCSRTNRSHISSSMCNLCGRFLRLCHIQRDTLGRWLQHLPGWLLFCSECSCLHTMPHRHHNSINRKHLSSGMQYMRTRILRHIHQQQWHTQRLWLHVVPPGPFHGQPRRKHFAGRVHKLRSWFHRHGRWRLHNLPGRLVGPNWDDGMRPLLPRHVLACRRGCLHSLPFRRLRQLRGPHLCRLLRRVQPGLGLPHGHGLSSSARTHLGPLLRLHGRARLPSFAGPAALAGCAPGQPAEGRPHYLDARRVPAARRQLQHGGR